MRTRLTLLAALAVIVTWSLAAAEPAGSFTPTGALVHARAYHSALLLRDGRVLIVGGLETDAQGRTRQVSSIEIYDPATGRFTEAGSTLTESDHGIVTLLQDGRVLIAGSDRTAEIYDPSTAQSTRTGDMVAAHGGAATLLGNGKVLIAGGVGEPAGGRQTAARPEIFDPATGTFSLTGSYVSAGDGIYITGGPNVAAITALPDGSVLLAAEPGSEIFDPSTGTFRTTGSMATPCLGALGGDPNFHPGYIGGRTATLLTSGKVLLAGGEHEDCGRFAEAELFDPATGSFVLTGSMARPRSSHNATLLSDGRVLITGGETSDCGGSGCWFAGVSATAEIYDPASATFADAGNMAGGRRFGHTATRLANGAVLIAGGHAFPQPCCMASAELFVPAAGASGRRRSTRR